MLESRVGVGVRDGVRLGLQGFGELETPLLLHLGDAQESSTHERDDNRGDDGENTLVDVLSWAPVVSAIAVEGADQTAAGDEAYQKPCERAVPYLGRSVAFNQRGGYEDQPASEASGTKLCRGLDQYSV